VHRLTAAQFQGEVVAVEHAVRAEYAWDAGVAIGHYLAGLREGRILGRSCRRCRRVLVPPRMFCEACFRPTNEWVDVGQTGTVATFSICHVSWDMQPLDVPELPAVVHLDGASAGMGILHKLGNVRPEQVVMGMPVRAVWKPPAERTGSILDIRFWEPIDPVGGQPASSDAGSVSALAEPRGPERDAEVAPSPAEPPGPEGA
jgi:uncharacterized OB-fold protein